MTDYWNAEYYADRHRIAIEAHERHRKAADDLANAYRLLRKTQRIQNGDARSIQFADQCMRNVRRVDVPAIDTEIDRLEQAQDSTNWTQFPPGTVKAPIALMSKRCYTRKQKASIQNDRSNFNLDMIQGDGLWSPWKCLGGGMSSSDVWLQFDANDNITDVSQSRV